MGRPTKLTPDVQARICKSLELGVHLDDAAMSGGIDYSTLRNWMLRGDKEGTGPFFEFSEAVKAAQANAVVFHMASITKASKDGKWQASAWILERRHPEKYGRTITEVEDARKNVRDLTDDELDAEILQMADHIRDKKNAAK